MHVAARKRFAWLVRRWWVWVPGAALLLRIGWVAITGKPDLSWGDEGAYHLLARNVAAGECYCFTPGEPSVLRAPLYPLMIAGLYLLVGPNPQAVLIAQVFAGGLGALLVVLVARALLGKLGPSILAGLMYAAHPLLVYASGLLYSETVYLVIVLLFTLSCLRAVRGPCSLAWASAAGGMLGLSVLMKPNLLGLPLPLFAWMWYVLRDFRPALVRSALVCLVMTGVVAPWTVRNYRLTGTLVPVSANSGVNLWQGNHPLVDGAAYPLDALDPLHGYSEVEKDRTYRRWALNRIRSSPGAFVRLVPRKLVKFFSLLQTSNRGRISARWGFLVDGAWIGFLCLTVWGSWRLASASRESVLLHLLVLYPVALAAVFYGATRYSMVTYPFLFVFGAEPVHWLGSRLAVRWQPSGVRA